MIAFALPFELSKNEGRQKKLGMLSTPAYCAALSESLPFLVKNLWFFDKLKHACFLKNRRVFMLFIWVALCEMNQWFCAERLSLS